MAEYFRRGTSKIHFAPTISNTAAPTQAELNTSGEDLTGQIADVSGFEFENSPIPTPKLSTTFTTV